MTGPLAFSLAFYRFNRAYRSLSDLIIGTTFEPHKDIVLVTGGSSGLGKELVKQFVAKRTSKVIVLDIEVPSFEEDRIEGVIYFKCDVSNHDEVSAIGDKILQEIGTVTVLINNAGITRGKPLLDLSYEDIDKTIQVNLLSHFYTIKTFLPEMIKINRGYIITIGSVLGYLSPARLSAYGAAKSGLIGLHESLTYELGPPSMSPEGVKTLLVCPGQLKTKMFNGVKTPSILFAPELEPSYVAKSIIKAIEFGRRGEIKLPFYGNLIPAVRAFPWPMVEIVRGVSGMDSSMKRFVGNIRKVTTPGGSLASSALEASGV